MTTGLVRRYEAAGVAPGVQLYTQTGSVTKGELTLPVYRCARGSTSLESFHNHLNHFIPVKITHIHLEERALTWKISRLICLRIWSGGSRTALLLPSHTMLPCRCAATVAHSSTASMSSASVFLAVLCKTTPSQDSTQASSLGWSTCARSSSGSSGRTLGGTQMSQTESQRTWEM